MSLTLFVSLDVTNASAHVTDSCHVVLHRNYVRRQQTSLTLFISLDVTDSVSSLMALIESNDLLVS